MAFNSSQKNLKIGQNPTFYFEPNFNFINLFTKTPPFQPKELVTYKNFLEKKFYQS
jgi:hypothetical protein